MTMDPSQKRPKLLLHPPRNSFWWWEENQLFLSVEILKEGMLRKGVWKSLLIRSETLFLL